jgi:hypothetical protein
LRDYRPKGDHRLSVYSEVTFDYLAHVDGKCLICIGDSLYLQMEGADGRDDFFASRIDDRLDMIQSAIERACEWRDETLDHGYDSDWMLNDSVFGLTMRVVLS